MEHTIELLTDIYENASTGKDVLERMIKHSEDSNFRQAMADQFAEYHEIQDKSGKLLEAFGISVGKPCKAVHATIFGSLRINLRIDRTSSHMAEMLMQGSLMGIIDISRAMRKYNNANEEANQLAQQLLSTEERNLNQMEAWL